jgi:hypothetical protein
MRSRPIEAVRALWGAALLFAPRVVLGRVHHVRIDGKSLVIARILGARQLAQAVLSGLDPSPEVLAMGVWVDGTHAATAVGLAVVDHARARAGITDAVVAAGWAAGGYRDLRNAHPTPPEHDRVRDMLARTVLGLVPGGGRLAALARAARERDAG